MGVKQWLADRLSRAGREPTDHDESDVDGADPDGMVELATVALADAPLIVAGLGREGIDAATIESFDPVSAITRARVTVRRADLPAAVEARDRLR